MAAEISYSELEELEDDIRSVINGALEPSENSSIQETVSNAGEEIEKLVVEYFDNSDRRISVYGEEGSKLSVESPELVVVVDPLDGSSAGVNGAREFLATGITGLKPQEIQEDGIIGVPYVSLIVQHGGRKSSFFAKDGEAYAKGEIRWSGAEVSWEDELADDVHKPREETSLENLNGVPGQIAAYAAKPSKSAARENILDQVAKQGNIRYYVWGGVMNDVKVGTGENLASFEPYPTKPSEAAGAYWTKCMGAEWRNMDNEVIEEIKIIYGKDGLERTLDGFVAPNPEMADEIYGAIEAEKMKEDAGREYHR